MLQLHKRQHPDYKYQPRRRRGQGADSPSIGGKGVFHFRLKFLTSSNKFYFSFPEEPLTPPHTPSEEDRLRLRGGLTLLEPPASLQESGANPEFLGVASGVPPIRWTVLSTWVLQDKHLPLSSPDPLFRYTGPYHHPPAEGNLPHGYTDLYPSQWRCPPPAAPLSSRASSSPTPASASTLPQYTPSPHSSPVTRPAPSPSDYSLVRPASSPSDYPAPSPVRGPAETYLPSPVRGSETYYSEYNQHYYQAYYFSHRQDWAPNQ